MYFGLIEVLYSVLLKDASKPEESWSQSVANYIRHNDEALIKNADKVNTAKLPGEISLGLKKYQD